MPLSMYDASVPVYTRDRVFAGKIDEAGLQTLEALIGRKGT